MLVRWTQVLFPRTLLYTFPVLGVDILGLLPELGKRVQLSVSSTDFVLEMSWEPLVKPIP